MPLVVLEGIDRAGKNTQTKLLARSLERRGKRVNCVSFPDYDTPIGQEIKRFLMEEVCFRSEVRQLLYVANRWEREEDISRWLKNGDVVLADRYIPAGLVYGMANGLDLDWMMGLEERLPRPDLVIVIDISPDVAAKRERDKDVYEKDINFQRRIRAVYLELADRLGWKVIDGGREAGVIAKDVIRLVEGIIDIDHSS